MTDRLHISPPWISFCRKINAMFKDDPEITIRCIEDPLTIKLYVDNTAKANALTKILPMEKDFGGVKVYIQVIPNNVSSQNPADLFKDAFKDNPVFVDMITVGDVYINPVNYCVFKNEVVQYWDDNLGDPHGRVSTLYQDIADDVFEDKYGVIFCTEYKE